MLADDTFDVAVRYLTPAVRRVRLTLFADDLEVASAEVAAGDGAHRFVAIQRRALPRQLGAVRLQARLAYALDDRPVEVTSAGIRLALEAPASTLTTLRRASDGAFRVSFVDGQLRSAVLNQRAEGATDVARATAALTGLEPLLGLRVRDALTPMAVDRDAQRRLRTVRFRQHHRGVAVPGGFAAVLLDGERVAVVSARLTTRFDDPPAEVAHTVIDWQAALARTFRDVTLLGPARLAWLDPTLTVGAAGRSRNPAPARLVWHRRISAVEAETGQAGRFDVYLDPTSAALVWITPRFTDDGGGTAGRAVREGNGFQPTNSCQNRLNNTTLVCSTPTGGCSPAANQSARALYGNLATVRDYYDNELCWDGWDDAGGSVNAYHDLDLWSGGTNAQYDSGCNRTYFSRGNVGLDTAGHEFTHGVDEFSSGLLYQNESGALDESLADVFGALIDGRSRGVPLDPQHGDRRPGGAIRDLSDPSLFGQPETYGAFVTSPNTAAGDWGGVHTNSGIMNLAAWRLVNGSQFHFVEGLGAARVADLYHRARTGVVGPSTTFLDFAYNVRDMAAYLGHVGQIGRDDACNVERAFESVGLELDWSVCTGGEDFDDDGVVDDDDNCPASYNPSQANLDGDRPGDVCDNDSDGDGVGNPADNCWLVPNRDQADADGDGLGDVCDDSDGDGIVDADDLCPGIASAWNTDQDGDGLAAPCDDDIDGDGVPNAADNCPLTPNRAQSNTDGDPFGNVCDNCPFTATMTPQVDLDGDGQGAACDADDDGDGVPDAADNCPRVANPSQADTNDDGRGDACDQTSVELVGLYQQGIDLAIVVPVVLPDDLQLLIELPGCLIVDCERPGDPLPLVLTLGGNRSLRYDVVTGFGDVLVSAEDLRAVVPPAGEVGYQALVTPRGSFGGAIPAGDLAETGGGVADALFLQLAISPDLAGQMIHFSLWAQ